MTFHRKTSVPTDPRLALARESDTHHAVAVMGTNRIGRQEAYIACLLSSMRVKYALGKKGGCFTLHCDTEKSGRRNSEFTV